MYGADFGFRRPQWNRPSSASSSRWSSPHVPWHSNIFTVGINPNSVSTSISTCVLVFQITAQFWLQLNHGFNFPSMYTVQLPTHCCNILSPAYDITTHRHDVCKLAQWSFDLFADGWPQYLTTRSPWKLMELIKQKLTHVRWSPNNDWHHRRLFTSHTTWSLNNSRQWEVLSGLLLMHTCHCRRGFN